jgi:superfamily II DNA/RNA helicase
MKKMMENKFPCVVYSNFIKNGIFPVVKALNSKNLSYKLITGSTTQDELEQIVNNYNKGNIKVLLLSSAGSESLDLKNTRQIHIMEPHWNFEKIKQVIGRAVRYKSHGELPKTQRNVKIFKWISIFGKKYKNISADEYLTRVSEKKMDVFAVFKKIIIDSSIENSNKNMKGGMYYNRYIRYKNRYIKLKT